MLRGGGLHAQALPGPSARLSAQGPPVPRPASHEALESRGGGWRWGPREPGRHTASAGGHRMPRATVGADAEREGPRLSHYHAAQGGPRVLGEPWAYCVETPRHSVRSVTPGHRDVAACGARARSDCLPLSPGLPTTASA